MSATVTTTEPRTVEQIKQEIEAARLARESATGQIKGNMTRQIKALERELARAQATAETEPAKQAKPRKATKKKPAGKFDSLGIVTLVSDAAEPMTVEQIAEALSKEVSGALKNRLRWLATKDEVLVEQIEKTKVEHDGKKRQAEVRRYSGPTDKTAQWIAARS